MMDDYKLAAYLGAIERKLDEILNYLQCICNDQVSEEQFIDHHDIIKDLLQELVDYTNDHY